MWRPKGWTKNPCDGCDKKQEDEHGLLCDLSCGKHSAYLNQEAGADAMLKGVIKWIRGFEESLMCPDKGREFPCYIVRKAAVNKLARRK